MRYPLVVLLAFGVPACGLGGTMRPATLKENLVAEEKAAERAAEERYGGSESETAGLNAKCVRLGPPVHTKDPDLTKAAQVASIDEKGMPVRQDLLVYHNEYFPTSYDIQYWRCPPTPAWLAAWASRAAREAREAAERAGWPGQLRWRGETYWKLELMKDGNVVSRADDWFRNVSTVVASSPAAFEYAKRAEDLGQSAATRANGALGFALGFLASTAVGVTGYFTNKPWLMWSGAGGMVVTLTFISIVGSDVSEDRAKSATEAMNAVDIYNDRHFSSGDTK